MGWIFPTYNIQGVSNGAHPVFCPNYSSMYNIMPSYTNGAQHNAYDKKNIITRPMTNFGLSIVFGNGKGDKWKAYLLPSRRNDN